MKRGTSLTARKQIENMFARRPGAVSSLPDLAPPKRLPVARPKLIAPSPAPIKGSKPTRKMLLRNGLR